MSATKSAEPLERAAVEAAVEAVVAQASGELSAIVGVSVELAARGISNVEAGDVVEADDPVVVVMCRSQGTPAVSIQLVLPRRTAAILAGLQLGQELAELADADSEPIDSGGLAALRGVLRVVVTAIEQALEAQLEGELQIQNALEVEEPASDPTWLDGSRFQRCRFSIGIDGVPESTLDLLLPPGADVAELPDVADRKIGLLDEPPGSRDADLLARQLGCIVETIACDRLYSEGADALSEWDGFLIPWEFGGRPGLDVVERLAAHDPPVRPVLLVSHTKPTRTIVQVALLAGAHSFVMEPFDTAEVLERACLGPVLTPEAAAAAEEDT